MARKGSYPSLNEGGLDRFTKTSSGGERAQVKLKIKKEKKVGGQRSPLSDLRSVGPPREETREGKLENIF